MTLVNILKVRLNRSNGILWEHLVLKGYKGGSLLLTPLGLGTYICITEPDLLRFGEWLSVSPVQGIIFSWTFGNNFSILILIQNFSAKEIHLKMSYLKYLSFCSRLKVLKRGEVIVNGESSQPCMTPCSILISFDSHVTLISFWSSWFSLIGETNDCCSCLNCSGGKPVCSERLC